MPDNTTLDDLVAHVKPDYDKIISFNTDLELKQIKLLKINNTIHGRTWQPKDEAEAEHRRGLFKEYIKAEEMKEKEKNKTSFEYLKEKWSKPYVPPKLKKGQRVVYKIGEGGFIEEHVVDINSKEAK